MPAEPVSGEAGMTKLEEYAGKAAASLAAAEAATTERDRSFHRRANQIWRKLIANVGEAEKRAALQPPPKPVRAVKGAAAIKARG